MTTAVPAGTCRAQRLALPGGERTWTVLGRDHRPVAPAEEYLEYLRVQRVSPNTVKSYARALGLWWEYLAVFGLDWDVVTLEDFGGFLTWLRTGDGPDVVTIETRPARFAESTVAVRLRAVLSCYTYHQLNGVDVGRDLHRITFGRSGNYKPLLEHVARRKGRRQAVIRVRQRRGVAPPTLTPGQIDRICEACATWDAGTRQWRGSVRNRLLWMLLAATGMFSGGRPTCRRCQSQCLCSSEADGGDGIDCDTCGAMTSCGVSPVFGRVELIHEFAVGGAGGSEVFVAFLQLQAQADELLLEVGDLLFEGVGVGGGAEPGFPPGLFAERFGEAPFQLLDAGVEPQGAFVGGEQVGLQ